ncbi:10281_t:CDS:2, partial [Gigaspora margarita]
SKSAIDAIKKVVETKGQENEPKSERHSGKKINDLADKLAKQGGKLIEMPFRTLVKKLLDTTQRVEWPLVRENNNKLYRSRLIDKN